MVTTQRERRFGVLKLGDTPVGIKLVFFLFLCSLRHEAKFELTYFNAFVASFAIKASAVEQSSGNTSNILNFFRDNKVCVVREEGVVPMARCKVIHSMVDGW